MRPERRYWRGRRCPICNGADGDPRGAERRCHGFLSDDGYAHCSREEHAGALKLSEGSNTYGHRLVGPCGCGTMHGEATAPEPSTAPGQSSLGRIVAKYDYCDESGALLYQVVRFDPKEFRQRRPDPKAGGRWIWDLKGTRRVLYHLDRVIEADPERVVYVVEGEKDVEALEALGLVATCNPQGAGKWSKVADCASTALRGRRVVVIADADEPGRRHAADVEARLRGVAASVRVIEPRRSKDAADWIEAGATVEEIEATETSAAVDVASDAPGETTVAPDPFAAELAAALADVRHALGAQNQAEREPLFFSAAELFKRDYPPTSWLVTGLATRGGLVMIGGEPKGLKTWMATAIALAVSSGTKVCGEFGTERGVVAYFYAEDLDRQVRNRLRAEMAGADLDPKFALPNLYLRTRGKFLDVTKDEDLAWIVASCRRIGKLDLLVLDPLRDISSAAEDKSDEMSRVLRRLRLLGELLGGCTVVVVHHTAKISETSAKRRPGQRLRGSSAIHGSVDSGIYLSDLDSDDPNTFHNVVDSEIKGARSAGRFELSLAIEDDANGEAVRATWTVSRVASRKPKGTKKAEAEAAKTKQDAADDDKVFAFVRKLAMRGEHRTRRKLRDHDEAPLSDRRMRAALDRLIELRRLVLDGPSVVIPEPEQHDAS